MNMPPLKLNEVLFYRWLSPILVSGIIFLAPYWLRGQFVTREEAREILELPHRVERVDLQLQRHELNDIIIAAQDLELLHKLPSKVQTLEERTAGLIASGAKRDDQIEKLVATLQSVVTHQQVANSKLDELTRRNERIENKLDQVSRKIE